MTRYIDADKLKEDILEENSWYLYNEFGSPTQFHELIDKQPTANVVEVTDKSMESLIKGLEILGDTKDRADVVEVVRCKDCRSGYPEIENDNGKIEVYYYCDGDCCYHSGNDYCSDGERRE